MKYKQPEEFFKYIIEKGNINIINDNQKCLAMALDLLDYEKTNFKLLKIAIENNVYKELFKAYNSDSNDKTHFINKAIKILSDDCCIKDDKAVEIVGWFASVIYPNEWGSFVNQKQELLLPLSERDVPIYNENFKGKIDEPNSNSILDNKNWTLEGIGLEMVYCPTGEFMMGSPAPIKDKKNYHGIFTDEIINGELGRDANEIQHRVVISDAFMIGKYPVTQEQYFKIMGNRPSFNSNSDNNPVENISLNEAKEFCEKLNFLFKNQLPKNYSFSLPSEAQWEYACRAGTTTSLNSGKNIISETGECYNLDEVAWYESNSNGITHPVGLKKPNAWGIYDMHGNVWEWCSDYWEAYSNNSETDPIKVNQNQRRVIRGGSFNEKAKNCRSAYRYLDDSFSKNNMIGFRIALTTNSKILYNQACRYISNTDIASNEFAITIFNEIIDFKDSKIIIEQIRTKNEQQKIETINGITNEILSNMVECPAGEFIMGSPAQKTIVKQGKYLGFIKDIEKKEGELGRFENEIQHKVIISKPFKIGKYQITRKEYAAVMWWNNSSDFKEENNPVEVEYWGYAMEFCDKLNKYAKNIPQGYKFDLPTEAQWEYACRAGTTTSLNSGKNITSETGECYNLDEVAWYESNSNGITHPVGLKKPNAWGIYDMHGNVWEWCKDLGYHYSHTTVTDPIGPTAGSSHSLRGGGCNSAPRLCRSANRSNTWVVGFDKNFGFRVALVPID